MLGAMKLTDMGEAMKQVTSLAGYFAQIARALDRLDAQSRETNALLREILQEAKRQ